MKFFFILIILITFSIEIVVIPFQINRYTQTSNNNKNDDIVKIIENDINNERPMGLIEIGEPPQYINVHLSIMDDKITITKKIIKENCLYKYEYTKSTSFQEDKTINKEKISSGSYSSSIIANDYIYIYKDIELSDINKEKINLRFGLSPYIKNYCNELNIGLLNLGNENNEDVVPPIFNQLKSKNLIKNNIWNLIFKKIEKNGINYDGFYIFGEETHKFYNNNILIKDNNLYKIISNDYSGKKRWNIIFDRIYYKIRHQSFPLSNTKIEFDFNNNFIVGSFNFFGGIYRDFFNNFLDRKLCFKETIINKYKAIYCIKNITQTDFNIKSFPLISFYSKQLNYTFELDYKDVFQPIQGTNYLLFKILNDNNYYSSGTGGDIWIFGRLFFEKYQLTFDEEDKIIGFYNPVENNNEENIKIVEEQLKNLKNKNNEINNDKNKTIFSAENNIIENNKENHKKINFIFYAILFIIIILFLLVIIFYKKILILKGLTITKLKKNANELNDDFEYINNDNLNNNKIKDINIEMLSSNKN